MYKKYTSPLLYSWDVGMKKDILDGSAREHSLLGEASLYRLSK